MPPQPSSGTRETTRTSCARLRCPRWRTGRSWSCCAIRRWASRPRQSPAPSGCSSGGLQLLLKPPARSEGAATNIGWHQDRHYWQVWEEGSELFTAWIALSDVTPEAGPMRFVRGSHRWGLQQSDFYGQDHEAQRRGIQVPTGHNWEEVPALLPPGGVSFHHNLTYHGSGPNQSGDASPELRRPPAHRAFSPAG